MSKVLMWTIEADDTIHEIGGGNVVHIESLFGFASQVQVWTLENDDHPFLSRKVKLFGTGHELPVGSYVLGSAVVARGALVWHVVELKKNIVGTESPWASS